MHNYRAFTLIEILIALFIFAIIGVIAAMSLHGLLRTQRELKKSDNQIMQLQMAMVMMRRDIAQMMNRPIRDSNGNVEPAFLAVGVNEIDFTCAGFDLQRVGYTLSGDDLIRLTWNSLDHETLEKPEQKILLQHVRSLHWQFVTGQNVTTNTWPPALGSNQQMENASPLPKVVLLVMTLQNKQVVQGVFPVPARGVYATKK